MKKTIAIILIAVSLTANSQDSTTGARPQTDTSKVFTAKDVDAFFNEIVMEIPAKYADVIRNWWRQRYAAALAEATRKKAGNKPQQ